MGDSNDRSSSPLPPSSSPGLVPRLPSSSPRTVIQTPSTSSSSGPPTSSPHLGSQRQPRYFYTGLPSKPERIASSRDDDPREPEYRYPPIHKLVLLEGDHPLASLWDFQIGPQVFRLTKAAVSGGEAEVDAVRIGTSANNMQALIWLGSPRGTISLGAANSLVRAVVQLCRHHGLLDIECEMRVTNVLKTTILINPFAVRAETAPWSDPFSLQVGTPITFRTDPAEDRLHSLGSLGVYLRLRDQPHAFALTAAHCLGLEEELPFMLRPDPNVLGNEVYIHTVDTFKADVDDLREKIAALDNESRYARDTINQMNRHGTHDPAAKNEYESQESAALASKTVLSAWLTTMETHYAEPKDRMIGRVHFRPPVLHSLMTPSNANDFGLGYSQDIGLIKTDILVDGPEAKDVNRIGLRMTADR
jgi:hypothetical protein